MLMKMTPNFALSDPSENKGRGGRDPTTEALPMTRIHFKAIHCVAADRGGLI